MRIALISDLHGNELALKAVLSDIERVGVDQLACLGDVATLGPRPQEVLSRLAALGCVCILGNHDEFMLDPDLIRSYSEAPIIVDAVDWCREQLSSSDRELIGRFERHHEFDLGGGASLFAFHGTPESNMTDLLATSPPGSVDTMLAGRSATVMAGGHTHIQMLRQHRGLLLVNPGSVGLPFREYVAGAAPTVMPYAEYAIVEARDRSVAIALHRVALDKVQLRAQATSVVHPLGAALAQMYA